MKTKFTIILFLITINLSYSQEEKWLLHQIDSLISIEFLGSVEDSTFYINKLKFHLTSSTINNSVLMVMRTSLEQRDEDKDSSKLPSDNKSLEKYYRGYLKGVKESYPFSLKSENFINVNSYKGFDAVFADSLGNTIIEMRMLLLNKKMYTLQYMSFSDFDNQTKNKFFNSLKVNNEVKVSQFIGNSDEGKTAYLIGEYSAYILLFVGLIVFIVRKMR